MDLLPVRGAEAGRAIPVLLLHVQRNNRVRPVEQVRNDIADSLPGPGWGIEEDMFRSAEAEHFSVFAAEQQSVLGS